jgi:hypothetical protein
LALFRNYERLFSEFPIRHLDLVDLQHPELLEALIVKLETDGFLERMVSLRIDGQELEDSQIDLLDRPSLSNLRWLSLAHNNIGYEGALALTSQNLRGLQFADLHGNPFDLVEQLAFDQGVVIDRSRDQVARRFPDVGWLQRRVVSGLLFQPSRYETVRGFTEENPEGGSTEGPGGSNRHDGGARSKTYPEEEKFTTA